MIPIAIYAQSPWDKYTLAPGSNTWGQWIRERASMVIGWHPWQGANIGSYNPLLVYADLYGIPNNPTPAPTDLAVTHPEWILRDINGQKLYLPWGCGGGSCPQWAGDLTNPGFRNNQMQWAQAIKAAGYQGIYWDDVDLALNASDGTGTIVAPAGVNPDNWARHMVEFLEEVRSSFPGFLIAHNAVWFSTNPAYQDRQIKACDYYNIERGYGDPNLGPEQDMKQLQFVEHVHALGRKVLQMEYDRTNLAFKIDAFKLGYKPGDLMIIEDLFPDVWDPLMDSTEL